MGGGGGAWGCSWGRGGGEERGGGCLAGEEKITCDITSSCQLDAKPLRAKPRKAMTMGIFASNDGRDEVDAGVAGCCASAPHVSFEKSGKKISDGGG